MLEHSFPDHHTFEPQDFQFDDDLPVIMTEKDAVKARLLATRKNSWYLTVDAHIEDDFFERIIARLKTI